jgi:hypothetical protein
MLVCFYLCILTIQYSSLFAYDMLSFLPAATHNYCTILLWSSRHSSWVAGPGTRDLGPVISVVTRASFTLPIINIHTLKKAVLLQVPTQKTLQKRIQKYRKWDDALFYFILFYFILFYFILCYFMLCLCYVMLCYVKFHFILFYFILFYFILFYFILFILFHDAVLLFIHRLIDRYCRKEQTWAWRFVAPGLSTMAITNRTQTK